MQKGSSASPIIHYPVSHEVAKRTDAKDFLMHKAAPIVRRDAGLAHVQGGLSARAPEQRFALAPSPLHQQVILGQTSKPRRRVGKSLLATVVRILHLFTATSDNVGIPTTWFRGSINLKTPYVKSIGLSTDEKID